MLSEVLLLFFGAIVYARGDVRSLLGAVLGWLMGLARDQYQNFEVEIRDAEWRRLDQVSKARAGAPPPPVATDGSWLNRTSCTQPHTPGLL